MKRAATLFALAAACGDDLGRHEIPPADAAPVTCRVPVSHPTIQAALDDASCPTVSIESGFYDENLAIARDLSLEAIGAVAIDGGDPAGCRGPDDAALRTDQRGLPRPVGVCDIGAVEVQP